MTRKPPTLKQLNEEYPAEVRLRFKTREEARKFMGQLSDGWGEEYVDLEWAWGSTKFEDSEFYAVRLNDEWFPD